MRGFGGGRMYLLLFGASSVLPPGPACECAPGRRGLGYLAQCIALAIGKK